MKHCVLAIAVTLLITTREAQVKLGESTAVTFADVDEAKKILTRRDEYVQRMSPFDRAVHMKTDKDVSEKDYLEFAGKSVLAWTDAEKQKITSVFRGIQEELRAWPLPLPMKVLLVKTDCEEGGAYTRSNAIVFCKDCLRMSEEEFRFTMLHELFHILSRANTGLSEKLYEAIGFVKCGEVAFPLELKSRKMTNPDAPRNDHCIRLRVEGKQHWAIPIIFSSSEKYDVKQRDAFFKYIRFRFLLVERDNASSTVKPMYEGQEPKLVDTKEVSGFYEQVGKNTKYIIHPEEILADNFAFLVMRKQELPSPTIIEKMKKILKEEVREEKGSAIKSNEYLEM